MGRETERKCDTCRYCIKDFDRQVFKSIVDYVIVGGYNVGGKRNGSKFVLYTHNK